MTTTIEFHWFWRVALWIWIAANGFLTLPTFAYDCQSRPEVEAKINYDDSCQIAIDYDRAALLAADENGERLDKEHAIFAVFVKFLAAEGGLSVQLTQEGLDTVANHLAQFDEFAPNTQMMQNLQNALAAGENVTGANANFYLHETTQAAFMQNGLSYDAAHTAALQQYGMSPFSLYTPEVIQANPTLFNNAWRAAAGLPPNP